VSSLPQPGPSLAALSVPPCNVVSVRASESPNPSPPCARSEPRAPCTNIRPSDPAEPAPAAPKRVRVSCAQVRSNVEQTSKHAIFDTRIKPGSWGHVPPELRRLPRQAKLCGADSLGQVVIASTIFGPELKSHYAPLFAKLGFEPLSCKVERGQTQRTCKRGRDAGILLTDQVNDTFVLAFLKRPDRRHSRDSGVPSAPT
jgi:hypothetical protein